MDRIMMKVSLFIFNFSGWFPENAIGMVRKPGTDYVV